MFVPVISARAKELGNKDDDYLIEVVNGFTGKTVGLLLIETGKGSFDITDGTSEGNWLVLRDSSNRVLAYSITDANLRQRFFGSYAAISPSGNQILVENYPGDLTLYDLTTGDVRSRLSLGTDAAFVRFSFDGKKLFVLSGEQTAYAFDVDRLIATAATASN